MAKVSVIIPIYNVEKFLRECLDSVCSQTLRDIEILCVDDGSTDSSPMILDEYAAKDKRFRIFKQENKGSGPARNIALDNAHGECVCFMDPDDKYPNEVVLARMYVTMESSTSNVVGGNLRLITEDGAFAGDKKNGYSGMVSYSETQQQYGYQCYIFRRSLIEDNAIRFPALWRRQDPPFFINCLLAAGTFYGIDDIVYSYRMRNSSRPVDWLANNALRLKDNLSGIEVVGKLAKSNGLWRLYAHNFRCLSDCGAFSTVAEADLVALRLQAFIRDVESSGKVAYAEIVRQATKMFLKEESRVKRYVAIARFFGWRVMLHVLSSVCKRRVRQLVKE